MRAVVARLEMTHANSLSLFSSIPSLWPVVIPYLIWIIAIDTAPENGGRPTKWMRKNWIWTAYAGYFPITLIKTAELPPDRTYIFASAPHGIISMGSVHFSPTFISGNLD